MAEGFNRSRADESDAKKLVAMAWPMIITQASFAFMQFADVWMVSRIGNRALAAITPATLMVSAIATFGLGFLTAVNTLVGQAYGAGGRKRCVHVTWQGIWSAGAIGLGSLVFYPTAPYLFSLFGHGQELLVLEVRYFEICLVAILPQLLAVSVGNYFLATGHPHKAMIGTLVGVLANCVLNYMLIFGAWGFPALGFSGAAWGTLIASTIHGMVMLAMFLLQTGARRLGAHQPRVSKRDLKLMGRIGIHSGIQDSVELVAWGLVLVYLIGQLGDIHLAAASVLIRCMQLSFLPADGFGSALTALVANAIGAGRHDKAQELTRLGFLMTASYMLSIAILVYVFRYPIMRLFSADPNVIAIGARAMVCVCLFQVFDAMNVTFSNALQGAGDSAWPSMVNAVLSAVVLFGGGSLVVHAFPGLGSFGIWSMATLYIALQGLSLAGRWYYGPWRTIDLKNDPDERNPDERNPDERNPDERNPDERNPDERNPDERNPDERNPDERNVSDERSDPGEPCRPEAEVEFDGSGVSCFDDIEQVYEAEALLRSRISDDRSRMGVNTDS